MVDRRVVSATLVSLLVVSPVAPSISAATRPVQAASSLTLKHNAVTCAVAGQYPQFEAAIQPAGSVAKARVYFRSSQNQELYYVEMKPAYVGRIPQPKLEIGSFVYYVEALSKDGTTAVTPESTVKVVEKKEDCKDQPVAAVAPGGPVSIASVGGATTAPAGFAGIGGMTAGGAITAGTAIAGGGTGVGTGTLIAGGAILAGLGTAVIVSQNSASK
jgi:hypothetical protein